MAINLTERLLFDTTRLAAFMDANELRPMDLVRYCGISVNMAYRIARGDPITDLNMFYKFYQGLSVNGYPVSWDWPETASDLAVAV